MNHACTAWLLADMAPSWRQKLGQIGVVSASEASSIKAPAGFGLGAGFLQHRLQNQTQHFCPPFATTEFQLKPGSFVLSGFTGWQLRFARSAGTAP